MKRRHDMQAGAICFAVGFFARGLEVVAMSLVATLICNPANPALDSTIVDGALAVLPSPGEAEWLFNEVAVDIPFTGSEDIKAMVSR